MRNVVLVVSIGLVLYGLTSFAQGADRHEKVTSVWEGRDVTGMVCLSILNRETQFPESARIWVVANEYALPARESNGVTCIDVPLSPRSVIRVATENDEIDVRVMKDYTSKYFAIVLPVAAN